MKNMKVSTRIIVGFLIVATVALAVGLIGVAGMKSLNGSYSEAIEVHALPLTEFSDAIEDLLYMRTIVRDTVIFNEDSKKLQQLESDLQSRMESFEGHINYYEATIRSQEALESLRAAMSIYNSQEKPAFLKIIDDAKKGAEPAALISEMETTNSLADSTIEKLYFTRDAKINNLNETSAKSDSLYGKLFWALLLVSAAAFAISIILGLYISGMISRPLTLLAEFMEIAHTTGDLTLRQEDIEVISEYAKHNDEIGRAIGSTAKFLQYITAITDEMERISTGDLTVDVNVLSPADTMGNSLDRMVEGLNGMFSNIINTTEQVSSGSKQIADAAQALAQGAIHQAATVEELSSSLNEIAQKTKENAETAIKTSKLSDTIKDNAEKGSQQMDEMMTAVSDITEASSNISKIIKTIDDIAFQTNILALNAAVEAARAGQHGKGFAVVAEEVRNLAAKSAVAAKDTGDLIANSMEKAELGSRIANETAASLAEIVAGINESGQFIGQIAESSEEQSQGITMINDGIDQVSQVVQQNSATAEQSAAASEELSSQATVLDELVSEFRLKK